MSTSLEQLREQPHLSVSALKMFVACPRKHSLHYLQKARASHRQISLTFGHAWHELVGHVLLLHQRGVEASADDLRDYFASALTREIAADGPPVLFEDDEGVPELVDTAMRMLAALRAAVPLPERLRHVELPFSLEIVDPDTGEVLPMPLIGAIDAVIGDSRRLELWELKSAKRRWPEDSVLYDFQPTAYRAAMRAMAAQARKTPEVHLKLIVVTKANEPDVQIEDLVRTAADERDLMETAASINRAVQSGCAHPLRGWRCKTCEYAHACR